MFGVAEEVKPKTDIDEIIRQAQAIVDKDRVEKAGLPQVVPEEAPPKGWILKEMKPKHIQAMALLSTGMKCTEIARTVGMTPQYVTMLANQDICKEYLAECSKYHMVRCEAMIEQSIDVIADTLKNGSYSEKIKAARLQLELIKKVGPREGAGLNTDNNSGRLENLANRLVSLLGGKQEVVDGDFTEVPGTAVRDSTTDAGARLEQGIRGSGHSSDQAPAPSEDGNPEG